MMEQGAIVFPTVVCGPGLLCLADLPKQIVFLLLKLVVAGSQCLCSIFGYFLFSKKALFFTAASSRSRWAYSCCF